MDSAKADAVRDGARTYRVFKSTLSEGWDVVCMNGPDPLYVIDHCASEDEARELAATYTTATR